MCLAYIVSPDKFVYFIHKFTKITACCFCTAPERKARVPTFNFPGAMLTSLNS
jgi:hypothetical protein